MVCHKKKLTEGHMASFPILFPEHVVEPNLSSLSLYPLKPGHFIQKNKNKQDLCGCMVTPVYKCHNNKKIKIPGGFASSVSEQEHTCLQVCFFASVRSEPMWALSDWGDVTSLWGTDATCQFKPVCRSWVWLIHFEKPIGKKMFLFIVTPEVTHTCSNWVKLMHKQGFHLNLLNLEDKRRMTHFFRDLSLIFGVTSILLLCVYSVICCLTKGLMTVFLQNGIFLHYLSFYLLKPDSNRYCGSVMNTDTHMSNRYFFFVHHFKCYLFLPANMQAKNTYSTRVTAYLTNMFYWHFTLLLGTHQWLLSVYMP